MSRLALIPMFMGESTATHSLRKNRLDYLDKTIESLKNDFEILIGVTTEEEQDLLIDFPYDKVSLNCNPIHLPSYLCNFAKSLTDFERILLTEADQVFYGDYSILDEFVIGNNYLVPHRLEKLYKHFGGDRGPFVTFLNNAYICPNSFETTKEELGYYAPSNAVEGFGGAFYCTKTLLDNVVFSFSAQLPIEHGTGFDIYKTGSCFKTKSKLGFFVEHLSGYEFHCKIGGYIC